MAKPPQGKVFIGISGWRYPRWRGVFYPPKLAQRRELEFAAQHFNSVEINGSFYSMQRPSSYARWADQTPPDFLFAVKGPRFITHMLKLRDIDQALANFFASGVLALGAKLGPVLWQLPPQTQFSADRAADRFAPFFAQLPRSHGQAAALAIEHHPRFAGRVQTTRQPGVPSSTPIRHCIEVRHQSFVTPAFIALLRRHRIGLVVADTVDWPLLFDITADFVYVRLHGSEVLYTSRYHESALAVWADRIAAWATGRPTDDPCAHSRSARRTPRDVFVYFDNDAEVHAPVDAQTLTRLVARRLG